MWSRRERSHSYGRRWSPREHARSRRHCAVSRDCDCFRRSMNRSRSRERGYRPRRRSGRKHQSRSAGSCVRGHSGSHSAVPKPTLQHLVSLLVGLTEKRNENGSIPRCVVKGAAADPRSRLEPGVAAAAPAPNASIRTIRQELRDLLGGCPSRGERTSIQLIRRTVRARLGKTSVPGCSPCHLRRLPRVGVAGQARRL